MKNAALNFCVQDFVWTYIFIFPSYTYKSRIAEPLLIVALHFPNDQWYWTSFVLNP